MTISDVSNITGLDWKTVKDIDKYYIKKRLVGIETLTPRKLGIDEVAYEKGHKYLTIVRDLDLNQVIWIGVDRKRETLDSFFIILGKEKQRLITVVVMDMWDPYIASIKEYCPMADIVFDKFHIIKKVNEAVDTIRKQEFAKAAEEERIQMKRKRFIILKRGKNLTEEQQEKLQDIMENNEQLYKAYLLKEQISDIFDEECYPAAMQRIERWKDNVNESELPQLKTVLKTFKRYGYGISNYFIHRLTNAGSEGFNTKINIIRRKAYGFWDLDYFMLKIYQACGVMKIDTT
jgi:transposase